MNRVCWWSTPCLEFLQCPPLLNYDSDLTDYLSIFEKQNETTSYHAVLRNVMVEFQQSLRWKRNICSVSLYVDKVTWWKTLVTNSMIWPLLPWFHANLGHPCKIIFASVQHCYHHPYLSAHSEDFACDECQWTKHFALDVVCSLIGPLLVFLGKKLPLI